MRAGVSAVGCRPLLDCGARGTSFFPEAPCTNNFAMVAAAMLAIYIVPMVLRPGRFAVSALINPITK